MQKNEKGNLTIEATLSLTIFLFFMMFIMNMGQIYQTQNFVTHEVMQTGKNLAFNSYDYDNVSFTEELFSFVKALALQGVSEKDNIRHYWKAKNYIASVKETFQCMAEDMDGQLKKLKVVDGVDGIDFTGTEVKDDNLIINVKYDIELPFAFFNFDKVTMHQKVASGLWQ